MTSDQNHTFRKISETNDLKVFFLANWIGFLLEIADAKHLGFSGRGVNAAPSTRYSHHMRQTIGFGRSEFGNGSPSDQVRDVKAPKP